MPGPLPAFIFFRLSFSIPFHLLRLKAEGPSKRKSTHLTKEGVSSIVLRVFGLSSLAPNGDADGDDGDNGDMGAEAEITLGVVITVACAKLGKLPFTY